MRLAWFLLADWGREGGDGAQFANGQLYQPGTDGTCPETDDTPFFISVGGDPRVDALGQGKDSPCVQVTHISIQCELIICACTTQCSSNVQPHVDGLTVLLGSLATLLYQNQDKSTRAQWG